MPDWRKPSDGENLTTVTNSLPNPVYAEALKER
jgi:hypothetical protein